MSTKTKAELETIVKHQLDKIIELEKENKILKEMLQHQQLIRRAFHDEETIKLMYSMYLNGSSFRDIASYLNSNNIAPKRSDSWNKSAVRLILKDIYNLYKYLNEEDREQFHLLIEKNTKNRSHLTK